MNKLDQPSVGVAVSTQDVDGYVKMWDGKSRLTWRAKVIGG
jgi:hypothetical protein